MCGLAGIWNYASRQEVSAAALSRFTRALAHRGPDGEGFYLDPGNGLGLGHRRLAILDLTPAGRQPLASLDGRYHVALNGEIFNFLELRRELEGAGYRFRTRTDTEVIPAAYDRWGPEALLRFNGMWALALWDARERTLFLARDRFGVKPLFYLHTPERLAFASELKAFLCLQDFSPRHSRTALRRILTNPFSLEGGADCLLEEILRLPTGHWLRARPDGLQLARWWRTLDHLEEAPREPEARADRFRELFLDACRLRLRSDVPVGTCLSGGLDSSAVLGALAHLARERPSASARRAARWQQAFVASFPGAATDERPQAELAIHHAGAEPHWLSLDGATLAADLEKLLYQFEEIAATLPWPMWALYRELRRHNVFVSLDGHGADEMLGGYPHYTRPALWEGWGLLSLARNLDCLRVRRDLAPGSSLLSLVLRNADLICLPGGLAPASWRSRGRLALKRLGARRFFPWLREPLVQEPRPDAAEERTLNRLGALTAQLYVDFHCTILPTILRNFDRCSMAHGVEVRMPFLDWRLVCYAFSLPAAAKFGRGCSKAILREAARGLLPEELRLRKEKIGFNSPLPHWFATALKEPLRAWVHDRAFLESSLWHGPRLRDLVEERSAGGGWTWDETTRVWLAVQTFLWQRVFQPAAN